MKGLQERGKERLSKSYAEKRKNIIVYLKMRVTEFI